MESYSNKMNLNQFVILLIPIFTTILLRLNLIDFPLERDEGEYAYLGQLFLESIPPYTESFTMKLPGTYFFFGILFQFFGESIRTIHISLVLIQVLILFILYFSLKEIFSVLSLFFILMSFAVVNTAEIFLGFAFHATHLVSLFFLISFLLFIKAKNKSSNLFFFFSGFFLCISFLMKQQAIYLVLGSFIIYPIYLKLESFEFKKIFYSGLSFGFGFLFILLCLFIYLVQKNILQDFWFWCFDYSSKYVGLVSFSEGIQNFLYITKIFHKNFPYLIPLFGLGILILPFIKLEKKDKFLLFCFLIFSFLTITPGLFFRGHYFIPFIPFFVIFSGIPIFYLEQRFQNPKIIKILFFIILLINFYGVNKNKNYYLKKDLVETYRFNYLGAPFIEAIQISEFIQKESKPNDKIAIIGSEPEIFFYTKLKSLTGFIYLYPLMEKHIYSYKLLNDMLEGIQIKKPKFIILVHAEMNHLASISYKENSDLLKQKVFEIESNPNYEKIGIVQIMRSNSEYYFKEDLKKFIKKDGELVSIYKLK